MTKKILIADDDPHTVTVISSRLKANNFDVVVAYDAVQTMSQVRKEKPDLIILDMKMPAGGGNSVLDNLKMSIDVFNTPVIVITAYPSEATRQKALEMGVADFITKPFKPEEILAKVKKALGETGPEEESRSIAKKILVVDDNPNIVKLLEYRLKANEYEVITAHDGEEALDKVRLAKPDLMILDVVIPKLDGYKVLSILRADEQYKDIPVVMLTAHGQAKDVEKGLELGAVSYITKPFKPDVLLGVIKGAVGG
jgi:DNA-binding response OmpR family regulator